MLIWDKKGDTDNYFYDTDGKVYSLQNRELPNEILNDLGYGAKSSPMGMVIDKVFEYYVPATSASDNPFPWKILMPGNIFPIGRLFRTPTQHSYTPNNLLYR